MIPSISNDIPSFRLAPPSLQSFHFYSINIVIAHEVPTKSSEHIDALHMVSNSILDTPTIRPKCLTLNTRNIRI